MSGCGAGSLHGTLEGTASGGGRAARAVRHGPAAAGTVGQLWPRFTLLHSHSSLPRTPPPPRSPAQPATGACQTEAPWATLPAPLPVRRPCRPPPATCWIGGCACCRSSALQEVSSALNALRDSRRLQPASGRTTHPPHLAPPQEPSRRPPPPLRRRHNATSEPSRRQAGAPRPSSSSLWSTSPPRPPAPSPPSRLP